MHLNCNRLIEPHPFTVEYFRKEKFKAANQAEFESLLQEKKWKKEGGIG